MQTTRTLTWLVAVAFLALVLLALPISTARAATSIVRVKVGGATSGSCGGTWANACGLQHALASTVGPDAELWVAAGAYKPGVLRTDAFQLKSGVALYGGFAGSESMRSQRNITANVTILSGDIGSAGDSSDNAYHVVTTTNGIAQSAVLDGFSVTAGNADTGVDSPDPYNYGGGMYVGSGSPTIANVTFSHNLARFRGGGLYVESGSPMLTNVAFSANSANHFGGGMYVQSGSPTLTNVTFSGNWADIGSGMYNSNGNPAVTDATFSGNNAGYQAGGMYNESGNPALKNVTFSDNHAVWNSGGGIYIGGGSPTFTNVTFSGNTAPAGFGGGMYVGDGFPTLTNVTFSGGNSASQGGGLARVAGDVTISNAIFWGNTAPVGSQIQNFGIGAPSLSDSVVQGGYAGGTNIITADPRLGALGNYGGSTQTIPLLRGSSAIDAGNDATCADYDQRGIPRPQGAHCDVGAFESIWLHLPLIRK